MRLIDADAIPYTMLYKENWIKGTGREEQGVWKSDIDKMPTVEPKHGWWIGDAKTYYEELIKRGLGVDEYTPYFTDDIACSECLAKYSTIDNETQFFKFCPKCGADMRGGQE